MPLILIVGYPCTGKTVFASRLVEFFKNRGIENIELINEENLKINKKEGYATSQCEKHTRGSLKSAVDNKLNAECYVVLDSLNYIKGFRYELYCSARTFRTPHCVVWVECGEVQATLWNAKRFEDTGDGYESQTLTDLRRRFEAPNASNRWDSPLFKINTGSAHEVSLESSSVTAPLITDDLESIKPTPEVRSACKTSWRPVKVTRAGDLPSMTFSSVGNRNLENSGNDISTSVFFSGTRVDRSTDSLLREFSTVDETLPRIADYFFNAVVPAPNASTVAIQHAQPDLLYELDRTSQGILQLIIAHQTDNIEGTPIKFIEYDREITLHRHAGLAELQRHRRQFVKNNGAHPPTTVKEVGASFIDFLANQL